MKNKYFCKVINTKLPQSFMLAVSLYVVIAFVAAFSAHAQTYTGIIIKPEHVGVFYNIGSQQFEAYGVTASGAQVRITEEVDWYLDENPFPIQTMTPGDVAEISATGMLTVKSTWGRVNVKACYPKGCGPVAAPSTEPLVGLDLLLVKKFTVTPTTTPAAGGGVTPSVIQKVREGRAKSFTIDPGACYECTAVNGTCGGNLVGLTYTTDPVTADCTVDVEFTQLSYTATPSAIGGTNDPGGAQTEPCGNPVTFTFELTTPGDVATLDATDTCGGTLTDNLDGTWDYDIASLSTDCDAVVAFVPGSIATPQVTGGTADPATAQNVPTGSGVVFTFTPDDSCKIAKIDTVNDTCGGALSDNGDTTWDYTIASLAADCTAAVEFYVPDYTATPSAINGTSDAGGAQTLSCGSPVTFTFGPPTTPGDIAEVDATDTCGGTLTDKLNGTWDYDIASLTADCNAVVEFVTPPPVQYTLNVTSDGSGGGIGGVTSNPTGINCDTAGALGPCSLQFDSNSTVTLTAIVAVGSFGSWSGDCVVTGDPLVATVDMGTADKNCTATFNIP